jgi:Mg2+ and Co2+ transporter CorA
MDRTSFVPKTWQLPEAIRKRLGNSVGRQRLMNEDGHLLLILHQVPKSEDDEIRTAVLFWRNTAGEWKSHPTSGGLAGLDAHLASYRTAIHQLDEDVEAAKTPRQYFEVMRRMHPVQRSTRNMAEVLQEARQALPDETRMINMRDQAVDLERGIELIAADAKAGMEFTMAESASQHAISAMEASQEARRLNRLAAFFFPLATLVAVFGINSPNEVLGYPSFSTVVISGIVLGLIVYCIVSVRPRKGG